MIILSIKTETVIFTYIYTFSQQNYILLLVLKKKKIKEFWKNKSNKIIIIIIVKSSWPQLYSSSLLNSYYITFYALLERLIREKH